MQKANIFVIAMALVCYACGPGNVKKDPVGTPGTKSKASGDSTSGKSLPDSTVLNWTELAAWLPDVKGYQAQESTGENTHTGTSGSRYHAFARRQYKRNDKELIIEIIDYNNDHKTFNGLLNMYGFNTPVQNGQVQTRAVETGIPHVKALEAIYTDSKDIRLTLAVVDRFMIHISEPGGYDTRLPEQVIHAIPLQEMTGKYAVSAIVSTNGSK